MASSPQELMQALNRAVAACNNGRFAEAELICQQIVSQKPDFFDALHFMAIVQSRLGQPDKALASYDRALAVKPDDAPALSNRGALLQDLKRFDEALASYDRALKLRPEHAEVHYNRGNALKDLKRFEEALASYDRALALQAGLCRGAQQPRQRAAGAEAARRGAGELRPRARAAAGLRRGAQQPRQCAARAEAPRRGAGELRPRARAASPTMPRRSTTAATRCRS